MQVKVVHNIKQTDKWKGAKLTLLPPSSGLNADNVIFYFLNVSLTAAEKRIVLLGLNFDYHLKN